MSNCQFCNKETNTRSHKNHELRCPSNPNRVYKNGMTGKKGGNQYTKAAKLGLPKPQYDTTTREARGCFAWTREQRSENAKKQGFGGYRVNAGHSKKFKVVDSYGKETILQSSYELKCSEILNELGIKWLRPKALKYDQQNYFADFYLPEVDIWLDPKNNYKAKQDVEKINKVIEQNKVRLYVLLEHQLTKDYLQKLCS